jgi:hypothetical protein
MGFFKAEGPKVLKVRVWLLMVSTAAAHFSEIFAPPEDTSQAARHLMRSEPASLQCCCLDPRRHIRVFEKQEYRMRRGNQSAHWSLWYTPGIWQRM